MNWMDYREKLGIGFSDEEKFKHFKQKMRLHQFFRACLTPIIRLTIRLQSIMTRSMHASWNF